MSGLRVERGHSRRVEAPDLLRLVDAGEEELELEAIKVEDVELIRSTAFARRVERVDLRTERVREVAHRGRAQVEVTRRVDELVSGRERRAVAVGIRDHVRQVARRSTEVDADLLEEVVLDVEETRLDGDMASGELARAQGRFENRAHAAGDSVGGCVGRIAGAAGALVNAADVACDAAHDRHVVGVCTDVLAADVLAAHQLDRAAEGLEQGATLHRRRIADDHRLATTELHPGDRCLVGHPSCQAEDVGERFRLARVGTHADAAERGAQGRVVDRDDGVQAGATVACKDDFLVVVRCELFQYRHVHHSAPG